MAKYVRLRSSWPTSTLLGGMEYRDSASTDIRERFRAEQARIERERIERERREADEREEA